MAGNKRPFISVLFECCRIYVRIYLNADRKAYIGWCPRCSGKVEVKIDPGGLDARFFSAR